MKVLLRFEELRFWKSWSVWISRLESEVPLGRWPETEICIWPRVSRSVLGTPNWTFYNQNPSYKYKIVEESLYRRIGRTMRLLCTSRATAPYLFLGLAVLLVFFGYVLFQWNLRTKQEKKSGGSDSPEKSNI